jgi:hypothetical protein
MDKVHNSGDSECYTPSLEPFGFYMLEYAHGMTEPITIVKSNVRVVVETLCSKRRGGGDKTT